MLKIGITGGIGSGKTTVCKIFEQFEIPVYYADIKARELMNKDSILINELKQEFGEDIYSEAGELVRPKLAEIVFNNTTKLQKLNALVHPAVQRDFKQWASNQNNAPYVLKEAALMFESGSYKDLDYVVTVSAPKDVRIERVVARDDAKKEDVEKRMANQLSEEERLQRANYVIKNDGSEAVIPQVRKLHQLFLEKGNKIGLQ